jgi:RimJ/RimL family protein N-acetyltransferase
MQQPTLITDRLRLRPFSDDLSDVGALNAIQSDPDHMRYYPRPFDRAMTQAWIERWLADYERVGFGLWAIEDRVTGEFLGNCGPARQLVDDEAHVELGWSVTPRRASQGIATEAGIAARDWSFEVLRLDHLIALVRPENLPSRRVAEKLGMSVWRETLFGSTRWLHLVYRALPGGLDAD